MEMSAPDFDLAATLDSGQVFHWEVCGQGFVGAMGEEAVYLEQRGDALVVRPATAAKASFRYFSLDHSLAEIRASLPDEPVMREAAQFCRGVRIIRQPRWECVATFITSSMKQVAHIRQISQALRKRYGRQSVLYGKHVYAFPRAARLAKATESELRDCALGYRAKHLVATARLVASGAVNLDALAAMPDDELRAALCDLPGVGPKVANCVMLFAYERLSAFPIDVWVERVLREKYFPRRRKLTSGNLRDFATRHFGSYGGYAQQYLFHHARKTRRRRLSRQAG
jgi:N-glycosylase/DNA lyase